MKIMMTDGEGAPFRLHWLFQPGDDGYDPEEPAGAFLEPRGDEDSEVIGRVLIETFSLIENGDSEGYDRDGFYFYSKSRAQKACSLAREIFRARVNARPFPDWAKTALAAGWKAPRGWAPEPEALPEERLFYIWSRSARGGDYALFWGPSRSGYTDDLAKAGLYSEAEARAQEAAAERSGGDRNEVAVPVEMAKRLAVKQERVPFLSLLKVKEKNG